MKIYFDRFILGTPRLYIKQYPYAWIVFIALWAWPPSTIIFIFPAIILLGLFMVQWQYSAWMSTLREEQAPAGGKFYIDRPQIPIQCAVKNISLLLVVAGGLAFFLNQQIGLGAWQVFLMVIGFSLLYRDSTFFGAPTTYVITSRGIAFYFAPGHLDYRVFLKFSEIYRIERRGYAKDKSWTCFAPVRAMDGLLFIPKNPKGFTKFVEKLFIAPKDIDKFCEQLPYGFNE